MVDVRGYVRAAPNGAFVNVSAHRRRSDRYYASVSFTYEGYAQVFIIDRNTGASRTMLVGQGDLAQAIARSINTGRVRPREGFLR